MGSLFQLFPSEQQLFETHPLEADEAISNTWVAATTFAGIFAKHGGNLVLTNRRVLFEPLSLGPAAKYFLPFAEKQCSAYLSEMARADAVPGIVARLRLVSRQSAIAIFLISAHRFSPIWSGQNKKVRDEAVDIINRAIDQAAHVR